jgi:hypothetical protein
LFSKGYLCAGGSANCGFGASEVLLAHVYGIAFFIAVSGAARANLRVPIWFSFTQQRSSVRFA